MSKIYFCTKHQKWIEDMTIDEIERCQEEEKPKDNGCIYCPYLSILKKVDEDDGEDEV